MQNFLEIRDLGQLGKAIQAVRKSQNLRQDEVGRLSHSFIGDLETGKPTAQIGRILDALRELGIKLHVELPADIEQKTIEQLRALAR
jgi:transcriptional regulator with XRE-family HTH domain